MKKIVSLIGIAALAFVISCGGGKYGDIKGFINDVIETQEEFLGSVEKAGSADDIVNAVTVFGDRIVKLGEQSIELKKKYPDSDKWDKEPPAELKEDFDRLNAQTDKFEKVFINDNIKKYLMDPKVQKAFMDMGKKMENAKFFQ
ncbi:MAG TPA: hypothetical protein P5120_13990 [Spirochaetota bacterium]|nr:hypothetical protein [Spirochaetota bacterium]HPF07283.1 hypothetical protein [Spirochaetota bacterium]HPJ41443.1 hypothetical protein [Spirochaetota bacterium]HPR36456.1 hypothetical protein [Spirochaetota bacterium]HRX48626.1 hypothetical protein [Spirochaetota bacterium]